MNKLTREEVMHVAQLARIGINEKEMEKYQYQLKQLLDDIDKIKEVKNYDEDYLIAPINHNATLSHDEVGEMLTFREVKKNAPHMKGNFVEVPVMVHE